MTPPPSEKATAGEREYLNSPEEILYMQVFSPMLLNAFLACGVKHLTLVNPAYQDDKALFYYDTATTQLLRSLQNPDRNTGECANTAVKPAQRMNHIAGARALIRECKWDARSSGIGAACFWLNIGMEVLSCLAFNWQTSWDPDSWGLDMDFAAESNGAGAATAAAAASGDGFGSEELWVHRILYIVAKIANFRATIPRFQEPSPHDEQRRADPPRQPARAVAGPQAAVRQVEQRVPAHDAPLRLPLPLTDKLQVCLPQRLVRSSNAARLFYHTAQCLLAQTNPMEPGKASEEMRALQLHHAHQVCGIVAHTKDRGVASVAIRSLAIASAVLTDPREQEEVLEILDKIHTASGWRLGKIHSELKKSWGWPSPAGGNTPVMAHPDPRGGSSGGGGNFADFSLPNHPYQNWYEPPNRSNSYSSQTFL
uniref:C6 zinc finger domain-containing protein n=1 Tax=Colletotrichum fructicola (strain Nara gc5) TaxID=1213859 RepID=L2FRF3_COLFN